MNNTIKLDRLLGGISLVASVPFSEDDAIQYGKDLFEIGSRKARSVDVCDILAAWCIRNHVSVALAMNFLTSQTIPDRERAFSILVFNMMSTYADWEDRYIDYGMIHDDEILSIELAAIKRLEGRITNEQNIIDRMSNQHK